MSTALCAQSGTILCQYRISCIILHQYPLACSNPVPYYYRANLTRDLAQYVNVMSFFVTGKEATSESRPESGDTTIACHNVRSPASLKDCIVEVYAEAFGVYEAHNVATRSFSRREAQSLIRPSSELVVRFRLPSRSFVTAGHTRWP